VSERSQVLAALASKIHGEVAGRVMERLLRVGEATDEQLSQALGVDVNSMRRLLNELYESRLVRYRRVRDVEQGWYLYYWRVTDEDPARILEERRRRTVEVLKRRLEYEENNTFFRCPECGRKYTFDEIADYMFRCPECGAILDAVDNSTAVEKLREAIRKLEELKFE